MRAIPPTLTATTMLALAALVGGCATETPTTAIVDSRYPAIADGGDIGSALTVYKVWYATTLFRDPIAPGGESKMERTTPGADYAYAVLAVGWVPSSPEPPSALIPLQSTARLSVERGATVHIEVSDRTFAGRCAGGNPLSAAKADFITQRIFPGEFEGLSYDAATCTTTLPREAEARDGRGIVASTDATPDADATSGG